MTQKPNSSREQALGCAPIGKLLFKLSAPAIVAQVVNALYNIVDRIYIGHMEPDGDLALTGLGVCFGIIMFISALAALAGMGGGPRASIAMGEGDNDKAESYLGGSFTLLLVMAAVATAVFQIWKEPLLLAFGADESTVGYATEYLSVYLWGSIAVLISLGLNTYITIQGFSTTAMCTTLIGAVINIVLDPVFIFAFDMGVKGAALATVIAQVVSALWVLRFLTGKKSILKLRLRHMRLKPAVIGPIAALGVSPFIMQATESLVSISFNASLLKYGGTAAVGAMTICSSVMQVVWLPSQGLSQGAQPIISYNFGAGDFDRVKKAFRLLALSLMVYMVAATLFVELFPGVLVALFNDDPALTATARWAVRIYMSGMAIFWLQSACQQSFVALGQAKVSLFFALFRKVILLIPLIFILPHIFSDQVLGVLMAEPIADVVSALTCGAVFFWRLPKIIKKRQEQMSAQ